VSPYRRFTTITREDAMHDAATKIHAAHDAITTVVQAIEDNAAALALTPIGRSWLESAEAVRELMGASD
jgi:hypothetical protein